MSVTTSDSVVERGVFEVDKDLVGGGQILGVGGVRRPHNLDKSAKAKTQHSEQLLIDLGDEGVLVQVLCDLTRHQLSLLLVSEGEVLGDDL